MNAVLSEIATVKNTKESISGAVLDGVYYRDLK